MKTCDDEKGLNQDTIGKVRPTDGQAEIPFVSLLCSSLSTARLGLLGPSVQPVPLPRLLRRGPGRTRLLAGLDLIRGLGQQESGTVKCP